MGILRIDMIINKKDLDGYAYQILSEYNKYRFIKPWLRPGLISKVIDKLVSVQHRFIWTQYAINIIMNHDPT